MDEVVDDRLLKLIEETELKAIRFVKWSGEVLQDPSTAVHESQTRIGISVRPTEVGFECKYDVFAPLSSSSGECVAEIQMVVVAEFSVRTGPPDRDLIPPFVEQVAYFTAMPFIREGLQTMTARLGMRPVTLGLMKSIRPGPTRTGKAKVRVRSEGKAD